MVTLIVEANGSRESFEYDNLVEAVAAQGRIEEKARSFDTPDTERTFTYELDDDAQAAVIVQAERLSALRTFLGDATLPAVDAQAVSDIIDGPRETTSAGVWTLTIIDGSKITTSDHPSEVEGYAELAAAIFPNGDNQDDPHYATYQRLLSLLTGSLSDVTQEARDAFREADKSGLRWSLVPKPVVDLSGLDCACHSAEATSCPVHPNVTVDITITGQGIYQIEATTPAGIAWFADNLQAIQCEGPGTAYSDDQGYTQDIAEGATAAGLTVAVDGYLYLSGGARGKQVR